MEYYIFSVLIVSSVVWYYYAACSKVNKITEEYDDL